MIVFALDGDAGKIETLVPGNSPTGITASLLVSAEGLQAQVALMTVEDNSINFAENGTNPTAEAETDVGHTMTDGQSRLIRGISNLRNFRCIDRVSGSASKVKITVYF